MWVLLDDEGSPIRYFDYPHEGAIEIVEKKLTMDEMFEQLGECLL
jgi:hypothetical protein